MRLSDLRALLPVRPRKFGWGPIGFELGAERLHLVQLARDASPHALASAPLPTDSGPASEWLGDLVHKTLQGHPFRGRRVVTAMPDADTKLMVVSYRADSSTPESQVILDLVKERIDEPIHEYVVDYRPIRTDNEQPDARSALVASARRDAVVGYLELLRTAGLEVDALEIAPVAIHRLVARLEREDPSRNEVVLHCGKSRSHLLLLSGRRLVFYREVEFGADNATEALAKALGVSAESATSMLRLYGAWPPDESDEAWQDAAEALEVSQTVREILKPSAYALAEEIERAAVYVASEWRGATLDGVRLVGAFACWPRVDRLLESLVSIPVHVLDPFSVLPTAANRAVPAVERGDEMTLAVGLSLRGVASDG